MRSTEVEWVIIHLVLSNYLPPPESCCCYCCSFLSLFTSLSGKRSFFLQTFTRAQQSDSVSACVSGRVTNQCARLTAYELFLSTGESSRIIIWQKRHGGSRGGKHLSFNRENTVAPHRTVRLAPRRGVTALFLSALFLALIPQKWISVYKESARLHHRRGYWLGQKRGKLADSKAACELCCARKRREWRKWEQK